MLIVSDLCSCSRVNNIVFLTKKYLHSSFACMNRNKHSKIVLGIETSCDDTGCAIIDNSGKILGESIHSQTQTHLEMGGIMPIVAKEMHEENIGSVVNEALQSANLNLSEIDAIAVTTKPGLKSSLYVGTNYGKKLCLQSGKPFIPVHHMQAHALTARMLHEIEFPFLNLLISGGHCLLTVVQSPVKFLLLGYSLNDAPGEAFDKVARRLKLRLIPELSNSCGGEAMEKAAAKGNPEAIPLTVPMLRYRDCNFSFAGLKQAARQHIIKQEKKYDIAGSTIIPDVYDFCASFLLAVTRHLCHRVQRAMLFVGSNGLIPPNKQTLEEIDLTMEEEVRQQLQPPHQQNAQNGEFVNIRIFRFQDLLQKTVVRETDSCSFRMGRNLLPRRRQWS